MTQTERVLQLLRERGTQGLNPVDLQAPTCDGGKPVLRVAARVQELRDQGYEISKRIGPNRTATYFLTGELEPVPELPEPIDSAADPADGLFSADEFAARGDYKDAA